MNVFVHLGVAMRVLARFFGLVLVAGLLPVLASAGPATAATATGLVDFDGDGLTDVASGAYTRIAVQYGSGASVWIDWREVSSTEVTALGFAMAAHDLNGDGYTDLVATAPNHDSGHKGGNVFILYGSASGLRVDTVRKLSGGAGYTDRLGWSLAVMVGQPTLIVAGAPERTVDGKKRAGALVAWPLDAKGVPGSPTTITQSSSGIPGANESEDGFGYSLAASDSTLVVGTPYENVGSVVDAGSLTVLERTGRTSFKGVVRTQNSAGVPGTAERYDQFGWAVAIDRGWIVASAPSETLGNVLQAGQVQAFTYRTGSLAPKAVTSSIHQDSAGVPGGNERLDMFGMSLLVLRCGTGAAVAVGTPGEAVGSKGDSGVITVVPLGKGSTCPARAYDGSDLGAKVVADDLVGSSLGLVREPASDHDDLLALAQDGTGRLNPVAGTLVTRYAVLWGMASLNTGFSTPAS